MEFEVVTTAASRDLPKMVPSNVFVGLVAAVYVCNVILPRSRDSRFDESFGVYMASKPDFFVCIFPIASDKDPKSTNDDNAAVSM